MTHGMNLFVETVLASFGHNLCTLQMYLNIYSMERVFVLPASPNIGAFYVKQLLRDEPLMV